jgi:exonuclease III
MASQVKDKIKFNLILFLSITGIYAPNEDNKTTIKDEFFANLNEEIIKSGSGRQLILMGDMNGRIGRKQEIQ